MPVLCRWLLALALFASLPARGNAETILVFGDSISAALGVPIGKGWVDLLGETLKRAHARTRVVNASISGETTEGGKARLPALLAEYRPDVVLIELGGNDGLRGFPVTVTRANLLAMVDAAEAAGARVVLLGMRMPPNYGPAYTTAFHNVFVDIARARRIKLVPFLLDGIATRPELMQDDGVHPNVAAQPLIRDNVLPALNALRKK
jgi:acyl-CoA thioesterase I